MLIDREIERAKAPEEGHVIDKTKLTFYKVLQRHGCSSKSALSQNALMFKIPANKKMKIRVAARLRLDATFGFS